MTEQNIIAFIYVISYYFVANIGYYLIMCMMITPKINKYLLSVILGMGSVVLYFLTRGTSFQLVGMLLSFVVPALLFFKEKKSFCAIAVFFHLIIMTAADIFLHFFYMTFIGYYDTRVVPTNWKELILIVPSVALGLTVMYILAFIWRRIFRKIPIKSFNLFVLFPLGQFFFLATCTYKTWTDPNYIAFDMPFIWVAIIVSVFADITMFIALKDSAKLDETRERLSEAEKQMEAQLAYYDSLTEKFAEIREYRHDINNIVAVAESLLNEDISRSDGEAMISEIKERAAKTAVPMFCANPIINTVIWQKQQEAGQLGIDFSAEIDAGESFPFDKIDICSLFANLLDNAIREASGCEKGFVRLIAGRKSGVVFVTAENSSERVIKQGAKPKTTKKSGSFHGSGLEIIEKITAKYGGSFTLSAEKGTAVASAAMLPMDRSRTA